VKWLQLSAPAGGTPKEGNPRIRTQVAPSQVAPSQVAPSLEGHKPPGNLGGNPPPKIGRHNIHTS